MNYACANCGQNPAPAPGRYCTACEYQFAALPQPWLCSFCGSANQQGQSVCWQCHNNGLTPQQMTTPQPPAGEYWQCACGYAFNESSRCSNCKQAKPITPWKCSTCGYEYSLYDICDKCKNPKGKRIHNPPKETPREPPKPWKCSDTKCGYEYNMEPTCFKCKKAKPRSGSKSCCVVL